MTVRVQIIEGPLASSEAPPPGHGPGAVLIFEGVVRPDEDGQPIEALRYEAYQPMAARTLESIAREIVQSHQLIRFDVWHSAGVVPVGGCSLRVRIESPHRAEALQAMEVFIDRLKQDVPIWKHVVESPH